MGQPSSTQCQPHNRCSVHRQRFSKRDTAWDQPGTGAQVASIHPKTVLPVTHNRGDTTAPRCPVQAMGPRSTLLTAAFPPCPHLPPKAA